MTFRLPDSLLWAACNSDHLLLPDLRKVGRQLMADALGDVCRSASELRALAFLDRRPDDITIAVHQANGGGRLVLPLLLVYGFVVPDGDAGSEPSVAPARPGTGPD